MKNNFVLLIIIFLFFSCEDIQNKPIKKVGYCNNKLKLITAENIPNINLNLNNSKIYSIKQIENAFKNNICNKKLYYTIPYNLKSKKILIGKNSIHLKLKIYKHCKTFYSGWNNNMLIYVNNDVKLAIDKNIIPKDSLSKYITQYYLNNKQNTIGILLQWDEQVKADTLTYYVSKIIDGYLDAAQKFSFRKFNKDICTLTEKEIQILKSDFPFDFELNFNDVIELKTNSDTTVSIN